MSRARRLVICAASCALGALTASAWGLEVGDRLPAIGTVAWAGAAPAASAHRLTLTVLFAAGDPLDRAIMPRMTDLAHRHPEVAVVGYSADGAPAVRQLCQSLGAKLGFPVGAITSVEAYMPPVGLPCAVLSDGQGTVVWWGHPLDAPRPLADALAGDLRTPIPPPATIAAPPTCQATTIGPASGPACEPSRSPMDESPTTDWEEAPPPAPMRTVIVVDPWWCWNPSPLGWHARVPLPPLLPFLPPFGRFGHVGRDGRDGRDGHAGGHGDHDDGDHRR